MRSRDREVEAIVQAMDDQSDMVGGRMSYEVMVKNARAAIQVLEDHGWWQTTSTQTDWRANE